MKIGDLVIITHTAYEREIGVIVEIDVDSDPIVFFTDSLGRSSRELFFKSHVKVVYEDR